MGSKREEERNEKIIRGLMKLPPNRRCINCNSLGPQYVCTNFWTFVCMTCSGLHREFSHRVKSVSMSKFTSQEVDALQKGGNQRARELYLKAWDSDRQRLPDNSNVDKVHEFIKNMYVEKQYVVDKSSDRPARDPESMRSPEEEMRRASSYHSYSQSPPYDFQYEERRYGKHVTSLSRKPGSEHILYAGRFSNVSIPGDQVSSGMLSPNSQRDIGSPFSDTSSCLSRDTLWHPIVQCTPDANHGSNEERTMHEQRTVSSGSFGSFDSRSFKSVNSMGLPKVVSKPEQSVEITHRETSSVPSQSSLFNTVNGMDPFSKPIAPESVTPTPTIVCKPQLPSTQPVDSCQESPISSVPTFSKQQSVVSLISQASNVVVPGKEGWVTFDDPQNSVPDDNLTHTFVPSANGNNLGKFNPFSDDRNSSCQNSMGNGYSASTYTFWDDSLHKIESETNNTKFWYAFEDSSVQQPVQTMLRNGRQDAALCSSDANKSLGFGVHEAVSNDGIVRTLNHTDLPASSSSSHLNITLHDFATVPAADVEDSFATEHKPTNPFDLPRNADLEYCSMAQLWDMSLLQAALPTKQMSSPYVVDAYQSWSPRNSAPSYFPGGVAYHPENGSLGLILGQVQSASMSSIHAQGSVASVAGNPFA